MNKYTLIGLVGRTNSGKSTLLNTLIGKKIAAVSDKVNTTRVPLTGIYQQDLQSFLIFDAPGVCQSKSVLDRLIFQNILKIIEMSEVIWWAIDCEDQWKKDNQILADVLSKVNKPIFLLLNKIDLINKDILLTKIQLFKDKFPFSEIIPISGKKKINLSPLIKLSQKYAQPSLAKVNTKEFSLNNIFDIGKEVVREQILLQTHEEVPHQTILVKEHCFNNPKNVNLFFTLLVTNKSQKAILIGKNGNKVRNIRFESQKLLAKIWKKKISIFLKIKVHKDWFHDTTILHKLGINWDNYDYTGK